MWLYTDYKSRREPSAVSYYAVGGEERGCRGRRSILAVCAAYNTSTSIGSTEVQSRAPTLLVAVTCFSPERSGDMDECCCNLALGAAYHPAFACIVRLHPQRYWFKRRTISMFPSLVVSVSRTQFASVIGTFESRSVSHLMAREILVQTLASKVLPCTNGIVTCEVVEAGLSRETTTIVMVCLPTWWIDVTCPVTVGPSPRNTTGKRYRSEEGGGGMATGISRTVAPMKIGRRGVTCRDEDVVSLACPLEIGVAAMVSLKVTYKSKGEAGRRRISGVGFFVYGGGGGSRQEL